MSGFIKKLKISQKEIIMLGFRVWHNENKRFIQDDEDLFFISPEGNIEIFYVMENGHYIFENIPEKFVAMQSMGVEDRYATEIYQGDIILIRLGNHNLMTYRVWDFKDFYIKMFAGERKDLKVNVIIVGNEFENPEMEYDSDGKAQ